MASQSQLPFQAVVTATGSDGAEQATIARTPIRNAMLIAVF